MKTLRTIGMDLLAVFVCVNFAACSDDDGTPQPLADLVGTVWAGTNPFTGYGVEVSIGEPVATEGRDRREVCADTARFVAQSMGMPDATAERAEEIRRMRAEHQREA